VCSSDLRIKPSVIVKKTSEVIHVQEQESMARGLISSFSDFRRVAIEWYVFRMSSITWSSLVRVCSNGPRDGDGKGHALESKVSWIFG